MNKSLIWIAAVVVVLLSGAFAVRLAQNGPESKAGNLYAPVSEADHARGNGDTALVEYSDFQCPACGVYYPAVKQLEHDFSGKLKIVYRHFPLSQHQNAKPAAYAAEAAGLQGKFFEMHDVIFENQKLWEGSADGAVIFRTYAGKLGLDLSKYDADVRSDAVKDKVAADYEGGVKAGVNSTPSFYLNGKKMQNPKDYAELQSIVKNAVD